VENPESVRAVDKSDNGLHRGSALEVADVEKLLTFRGPPSGVCGTSLVLDLECAEPVASRLLLLRGVLGVAVCVVRVPFFCSPMCELARSPFPYIFFQFATSQLPQNVNFSSQKQKWRQRPRECSRRMGGRQVG
jgi:hypothetical protein